MLGELSVMEQRYHAVMEVHIRSAGQRGGPPLRGLPAGARHAHHARTHTDPVWETPMQASSVLPECLDNRAVVQSHDRGLGHPRRYIGGHFRPVHRLLPMPGNPDR